MNANAYLEIYENWKSNTFFDEETRKELSSLVDLNGKPDYKEIEDRFYSDLEFGTGGLRGLMGAGTNRMNKYTVGKATLGLSKYLNEIFGSVGRQRGVVIAFDTRNNSESMAKSAADVLTAVGIKVFIFDFPIPVSELSFAVRHLNCVAGIMLTASHNPKEYNGYKVYDEFGCQLVPKYADRIIKYINGVRDFEDIPMIGNDELMNYVGCEISDLFCQSVLRQSLLNDRIAKNSLKIVYTPIHGTGNIPVRNVLSMAGFSNVTVVKQQANPDGNFPTVKSPNPEERDTLIMGLELAKEIEADIVIGTDPDSDRVGVGVKIETGYQLLSGNQIGALLMDFVLSQRTNKSDKSAVIKTVVTSDLGAKIAEDHNIKVFNTLTGFKFIGEKITQFENARANNDNVMDYTFILGYEESYGYLIGTHARDKDAVVSSLLICEMAAYYKKFGYNSKGVGKNLFEVLNALYEKYGYFLDALDSFTLKGKEGMDKIQNMMMNLRTCVEDESVEAIFTDFVGNSELAEVIDYSIGIDDLPKSDVLKFILTDGSWIAIRPSGTEPKIKIYYSIKQDNEEKAEAKLSQVRRLLKDNLNLE